MRIAVVGSRDFPKKELVQEVVSRLVPGTVVISGGARGVDTWAENCAKLHGLEVIVFPAEWDLYGKSAGFRRNQQIIEAAEGVIAFWDGKSKGTKHSLDLAKKLRKRVLVYREDGSKDLSFDTKPIE